MIVKWIDNLICQFMISLIESRNSRRHKKLSRLMNLLSSNSTLIFSISLDLILSSATLYYIFFSLRTDTHLSWCVRRRAASSSLFSSNEREEDRKKNEKHMSCEYIECQCIRSSCVSSMKKSTFSTSQRLLLTSVCVMQHDRQISLQIFKTVDREWDMLSQNLY